MTSKIIFEFRYKKKVGRDMFLIVTPPNYEKSQIYGIRVNVSATI